MTAADLQARGRDDGAAQGRPAAQPGADGRGGAGLHPRRAVRQHRPRLQLGDRHQDGPRPRRLGGDRGRLRLRPRRREVLRHQVPDGGARSRRRGAGGHRARPQAPRRGGQGAARGAGRGGRGARARQPAQAHRERQDLRQDPGRRPQPLRHRLRRGDRAGAPGLRGAGGALRRGGPLRPRRRGGDRARPRRDRRREREHHSRSPRSTPWTSRSRPRSGRSPKPCTAPGTWRSLPPPSGT